MRKIVQIIFLSLIFITFFSCATTSASANDESNLSSPSDIKTPIEEEKLRFDDWKYKGFGNELPLWVENAVDNDEKALLKVISDVENATEIKIFSGRGENLDRAEQIAKDLVNDFLSGNADLKSSFIFYDNFWVRENIEIKTTDKPYISVYVYYK